MYLYYRYAHLRVVYSLEHIDDLIRVDAPLLRHLVEQILRGHMAALHHRKDLLYLRIALRNRLQHLLRVAGIADQVHHVLNVAQRIWG